MPSSGHVPTGLISRQTAYSIYDHLARSVHGQVSPTAMPFVRGNLVTVWCKGPRPFATGRHWSPTSRRTQHQASGMVRHQTSCIRHDTGIDEGKNQTHGKCAGLLKFPRSDDGPEILLFHLGGLHELVSRPRAFLLAGGSLYRRINQRDCRAN